MNVNDIVQERIEAARRRIERQKQVRAALAARRRHGLKARHARKLQHLDGGNPPGPQEEPDTEETL